MSWERTAGTPAWAILRPVIDRSGDPRTGDSIVYELLRGTPGSEPSVAGRAAFEGGRSEVEAPEEIAIAVRELLDRAFVDRVRADERPRGYRRSRQGAVEMLVPGMAEHFIARLRGLWLPYPDGSVVTARLAGAGTAVLAPSPDLGEAGAPVTDASVRRGTLLDSAERLAKQPLVAGNDPISGLRPGTERRAARSDCGWIA